MSWADRTFILYRCSADEGDRDPQNVGVIPGQYCYAPVGRIYETGFRGDHSGPSNRVLFYERLAYKLSLQDLTAMVLVSVSGVDDTLYSSDYDKLPDYKNGKNKSSQYAEI